MSFDPAADYQDNNYEGGDYYTLWHYKQGRWRSYGYLPQQDIIHYTRARPFQIKLEEDKWGLKAGWHIIYIKASWQQFTSHNWKILRLRHVGKRISEDQDGYKDPDYFDENWEVIDTIHLDPQYDDWYEGTALLGRGVYNKKFGIVMCADRRSQSYYFWSEIDPEDPEHSHIDMNIYCWKDSFYKITETSYTNGHVASEAMGQLVPWPGTFNTFLAAHYQADESHPDWPDKKVLFFYPEDKFDTNPWAYDLDSPEYTDPWLINENRDEPRVNIYRWQSNFWSCVSPLTMTWWEAPPMSGHESGYFPRYDKNYAIYQGPYNWRTLSNDPGPYWETGPLQLENSIWDWAEDGSCAESDFKLAYVRRKSDGSIWRFKNWNPITDVYTNFPNLDPRPTNPVSGVEYANFYMNGPPIPGNETWHTLMILK